MDRDTPDPAAPTPVTVAAWARLVRVQQALLASVEAELKHAGQPPLAWYDALLELSRAPEGRLRPTDLEKSVLLPQYTTSRLIDRLVKAGVATREACPLDGRGQVIAITPAGRALQAKMWATYGSSIERLVGSKLSVEEAIRLHELLGKLR